MSITFVLCKECLGEVLTAFNKGREISVRGLQGILTKDGTYT